MEELKDLNPSNWQYCKEAVLITIAHGGQSVTVALPVSTIFEEVQRQFKLAPVVGGPLVVGGLFSSIKRKAKKMSKRAVRSASKAVRKTIESKALKQVSKVSEQVARAYARPEVAMLARGVASAGIPVVSTAAGGVAVSSEATRQALSQYDRARRTARNIRRGGLRSAAGMAYQQAMRGR